MLTGWIGGAKQIAGSQETAKDLINQSIRLFERSGQRVRVGEARSDLARCYWREGAYDEARILLQEALADFGKDDIEQRAVVFLRQAEVERMSGRVSEALQVYKDCVPLVDRITDPFLTATFHQGYANLLNQLSSDENRKDYAELALIEYTAASIDFEQVGHERYQACVENNLGFLLGTLGRFNEAHEHLDRAQVLMARLNDSGHLAQVDETRARILLAEGRNVEAERVARAAVATLEKGDEATFLAEALITHGIALARLHHWAQVRGALEQAISIAERAGDSESAGLAALTLIEQLGEQLSEDELRVTLIHAEELVEKSENIATVRRLTKAAFRVLFSTPFEWKGFSLRRGVIQYEAHLIRLALRQSKGAVTEAARLLGFNHHQSLIALLKTRHKDLLSERKPLRRRFRHLMEHPKRPRKKPEH